MAAPSDAKGRAASSVQGLVRELVHQFTDPLDFYRELIQNSIDAESNRISVTLDYKDGRAVAGVEDDGVGMDGRIIDEFLLVLFRSTKDNDLTKIGKFGIGFVSVFAMAPERVQVFTAKNGESWRLDFPSYKHYDKYRMPALRDGTKVELTKAMTLQEYGAFSAASLAKVRYWCKHADTRIFFQDRTSGGPEVPVNEPFELDGAASLRYQEEGTEIVLGFSAEPRPFCGFYNRGLTLKEGEQDFQPGLQFKIKSRFLEHTLTRDNVLMDDNYRKAMAIIARLADRELPRRLKADLVELAQAVGRNPAAEALPQEWARRLPFLRRLFSGRLSRWRRSDWAVFPVLGGKPISLAQVHAAVSAGRGVLYFDAAANRVTEALGRRGLPVLPEGPWVAELAAWSGGARLLRASGALYLPRPLDDQELGSELLGFIETLRRMDADCGAKYRQLLPADFDYPGSSIVDRHFVTSRAPGELGSISDRPRPSLLWLGRERLCALLNIRHPFLCRLGRLHQQRPGLAAYLCLKTMHLSDGEVPPAQGDKFCNLAEKTERRLLESALTIDCTQAHQGGRT
jgi:hypothetical protein